MCECAGTYTSVFDTTLFSLKSQITKLKMKPQLHMGY